MTGRPENPKGSAPSTAPKGPDVSRRRFLSTAGIGMGAAVAMPRIARAEAPAPEATYMFFNAQEAAFIEPAVERLIPADERWGGALEAGVPTYIDRQLASAYGNGARLYLQGPWPKGKPEQGYQLPLAPAQLYRAALLGIERHFRGQGPNASFGALAPADQDKFLAGLEKGEVDLGGVPSDVFFETLLSNTVEGFLADPIYGGNRDMIGWRMIGFPGAYAAYVDTVGVHGMSFTREPVSIASGPVMHRHEKPKTAG
jgi:gluconate 2-dehydrogenase gamma chain